MRILFVCLGNICRSPLAHGVMESLVKEAGLGEKIEVDSCGMFGHPQNTPTHPGSQDIIRKRRGKAFSKPSRHWRKTDYDQFDLILAMDQENYVDIMDAIKGKDPNGKVRMFRSFDPEGPGDVPDPYYSGNFAEVYDIIERACKNIISLYCDGTLL